MPRRPVDEEDEDDVPWLEPATGQRRRRAGTTVSTRTLVAVGLVLILLVGGIVWGVRVLAEREEVRDAAFRVAASDAPLIRAPDEPYKRRPADPGGAEVEGIDQTLYAAGGGVDPGGNIALDQLPEEPMERPAPGGQPQGGSPGQPTVLLPDQMLADASEPPVAVSPGSAVTPAAPAPPAAPGAAPVPPPSGATKPDAPPGSPAGTGGGRSLQLGAFSSRKAADEAWKTLSGRYSYLAALSKDVERIERDGKSLFRLRAIGVSSRTQAETLCGRLKVAGEACLVAD
jgi:hypothetical protein